MYLPRRLSQENIQIAGVVGLSTHRYTLFSTPKGRNHNLIVLPACLGLQGFNALYVLSPVFPLVFPKYTSISIPESELDCDYAISIMRL